MKEVHTTFQKRRRKKEGLSLAARTETAIDWFALDSKDSVFLAGSDAVHFQRGGKEKKSEDRKSNGEGKKAVQDKHQRYIATKE